MTYRNNIASKSLFSFIVILHIVSCNSNHNKTSNDKFNLLKKSIDSIIEINKLNGVVLVTFDSSVIFKKNLGYSDFDNKSPISDSSQFIIGSISKQITAVLVLREFEKGKIDLNRTIGKYLPYLTAKWKDTVTVHHLLTHTHGIVDISKDLEFKPGTQFKYSQLGYELLSKILEFKTGKTFKILSSELFSELGLQHTYHPEDKRFTNLVKGYELNEKGKIQYCYNSFEYHPAAGSFISSAKDLSIWNHLLHSGKIVKSSTLEMMKTRYASRIHSILHKVEYGYGLLFIDGEEDIQIGALGFAPGFTSASFYYPKTKISLVIIENCTKHSNIKEIFKIHTEIMLLIKKFNSKN